MRKTISIICAAAAVGAIITGCGSSSSSGTAAAGIIVAPGSGATAAASNSAPTTPAATSTATVATPTSGPLSTEPKITVPSGPAPKTLQTKDLVTGTGATAKSGSTITVNYVGALYSNGKVFDASWKRKQTFTTPLSTGSVIPGWVKGIAGMKVGGRRELIIPPNEAYGKQGSGSTIPPNSTLIFIVDLLKVD